MRRSTRPGNRTAKQGEEALLQLEIPPDADATFEILRARKRPLSKAALHARVGEPVTDLIWATCRWGRRDWTLGDHRFLVFSTNPSEGVEVYVQFWSEPQDVVIWGSAPATGTSQPGKPWQAHQPSTSSASG